MLHKFSTFLDAFGDSQARPIVRFFSGVAWFVILGATFSTILFYAYVFQ